MLWLVVVTTAVVAARAAPVAAPEALEAPDVSYVEALMRAALVNGTEEKGPRGREFIVTDVAMRDGVELRTRVFVPKEWGGKTPLTAIVDRTPYGPAYTSMALLFLADPIYAIVMQCQRGTSRSGGEYQAWRQDGADFYDTAEWIVAQPWSDGKLISFGVSADANSVYATLEDPHPAMAAHFPIWGVNNGYALCFPNGCYREGLVRSWLRSTHEPTIPVIEANELFSEYWEPIVQEPPFDLGPSFPSVHFAGLWDIFLAGQIVAYRQYRAEPNAARSYLVIDRHGHCYQDAVLRGATSAPIELAREMFRRVSAGADVSSPFIEGIDLVTFFVQGPSDERRDVIGNYFTTLPDFPESTPRAFFVSGDGRLANEAPVANGTASYTSDPEDPIPMIGGNNLGGSCGTKDQSPILGREDLLVFTTEPFEEPLVITGESTATVYLASSAVDTDVIVRMMDVSEDGESSMLVQEGAVRGRLREADRTQFEPMVPGRMYEFQVPIWWTSYVIQPGRRLRIAIQSSNEPRWSANRQNGLPVSEQDDQPAVVAVNTVFFGRETPSRIEVPTVRLDQIPDNFERRPRDDFIQL